ncbi:Yip1 family protein [Paracidovorax sp. MALMAid1276]|uniref:Yip1 family protein n=1 Tax=Paracidovorax sp. MALMAid1276 TaxID=3411631 RepID=UPI003B9D7A95
MNSPEDTFSTTAGPAPAGAAMAHGLLDRVLAILLRPGEAWLQIEREDLPITRVVASYLLILAAIPAVAGFIGTSVVGIGAFGLSVRVPVVQGLVGMVVGYGMSLVMVFVMALVANALAPRFGGQAQLPRAFQLIAYGATAGWLGGVFSAVPALAMLGVLAALYSVYLIYRGVPTLMRVPQERAVGYTAAVIACGIVAALLVGLATSFVTPRPGGLGGLGGLGAPGTLGGASSVKLPGVNITVPGTDIHIDTAKVESASRRMEEAQARGDTQAAGKAMGDMMSAALGGKGAAPLAPEALRALLPTSLGAMPRTAVEARSDAAMGVQFTNVSAQYSEGERLIEVRMQDIGAVPALAIGMASWSRSTLDSETADEVERVYRRDGVAYKESYRKDGTSASLVMLLPNGVLLEGSGNLPMDDLRAALQAVPVGQVAALKRAS